MRTVITGLPRAGKSTAAKGMPNVRSCDAMKDTHSFEDAGRAVAGWMGGTEPSTIEGVAAVRGLRHWLQDNPTGKPCDTVVWMGVEKVPLSEGQRPMAKGIQTVWNQIRPELERRGVKVEHR